MLSPKNVLNSEDARTYAVATAGAHSEPHVQAWFTSTFATWLLREENHFVQCCTTKQNNEPTAVMLRFVLTHFTANSVAVRLPKFHVVAAPQTLDKWQAQALGENNLFYWQSPGVKSKAVHAHWRDYCDTLPAKQIRMTVDHMIAAVAKWDKALAKQKLQNDLNEGVAVVSSAAVASAPGYSLVKLETKIAFCAEGAAMAHCVGNGSYWKRKVKGSCTILSLRHVDEARPIATLELEHSGTSAKPAAPQLIQVRGYKNSVVSLEVNNLLHALAVEQGWQIYSAEDDEDEDWGVNQNEDEEDGDEEEDDGDGEEEEEDGEDDEEDDEDDEEDEDEEEDEAEDGLGYTD